MHVEGRRLQLTGKEHHILELLMLREGPALSIGNFWHTIGPAHQTEQSDRTGDWLNIGYNGPAPKGAGS